MAQEQRYEVGEVIANRFVVEKPLGQSPLGQSYLVNENHGSQRHYLKLYSAEVSSRYFQASNFFLKAGVLAEITHDNLAKMLEMNQEMERVYQLREWVEGMPFLDWSRTHGMEASGRTRGLEILWQAAQGLIELHQRGLHLNLHPRNLICGDFLCKLVDCDPRGPAEMDTGVALPHDSLFDGYFAPETQRRGEQSYSSSDLYSMGGLVYQLLTGSHPTSSHSRNQSRIGAYPREVFSFLSKAMSPKPEDRYQDAASFSDALWNLSQFVPQLPPPQSPESLPSGAPNPYEATEPYSPPMPVEPDLSNQSKTLIGGNAAFAEPPPVPTRQRKERNEPPVPTREEPSGASFTDAAFAPASDSDADVDVDFFSNPLTEATGNPAFTPSAPEAFPKPMAQPPSPPSRPTSSPLVPPPRQGVASPSNSGKPPSPPAARIDQTSFSLEDENYALGSDSQKASYTMLGFKGAGGNQTIAGALDESKEKRNKALFVTLISVGIGIVLAGGGLIAWLLLSAPSSNPARLPSASIRNVESQDAAKEASIVDGSDQDPLSVEEDDMPAPTSLNPSVEQPEFEAQPKSDAQSPPVAAQEIRYKGNAKVSAQREKTITEMLLAGKWPVTVDGILRMADDFNDLGRTAYANQAYSKALEHPGVDRKAKVHAFGGLAVTHNVLGQKQKALEALDRLEVVDPGNRFASSYRPKVGNP